MSTWFYNHMHFMFVNRYTSIRIQEYIYAHSLISMSVMQQQLANPAVVQCNSLVVTSTEHDSLMHPAPCLAAW